MLTLGLFTGVGCLVRKNMILLVIAIITVTLVIELSLFLKCLRRQSSLPYTKQRILNLILIQLILILCSVLPNSLVLKYYESTTGYTLGKGMPASTYIAMSWQNPEDGDGWFNAYAYNIFAESGYDSSIADQVGKSEINRIVTDIRDRSGTYVDFLKRKLRSQWIDPEFNASFCTRDLDSNPESVNFFARWMHSSNGRNFIVQYMNVFSSLIYLFAAIGIIIILFKKEFGLVFYIPYIYFLAGFCFHILWEAKSRYALPYYIMLIPTSVFILDYIMTKITKINDIDQFIKS